MFIRPGRTIYSVNVPCLAVAAPDVFKKVVILGDGARGAPSGAAGTILEPQLLNQRGFGLVKGKGEGVRQLGKRLNPARQVGVQGAAAAFAAVSGVVVGMYEGFFGPGSGAFFLLGIHVFLKTGLIKASGTAKIYDIFANLGAQFVPLPLPAL